MDLGLHLSGNSPDGKKPSTKYLVLAKVEGEYNAVFGVGLKGKRG